MLHLLLCTALSWSSPSQAILDATASEWKLSADTDAVQGKIDAAVERSLEAFPSLIRPLVRRQLTRHLFYCGHLDLDPSAAGWKSRCTTDERGFSRAWSPTETTVPGYDGEPVRSLLTWDDNSITLDFQGGGGGRKAHYVVQGDQLNLTITVYASRLPVPVEFELPYTRVAAASE